MARDPNANELQSIANAIQLIREVNYKDLTNLLDDFLQDDSFEIDNLPGGAIGYTIKRIIAGIRWGEKIILDPQIIPEKTILDRCNPDIVELAGTILHEGTHVECHDELAAWGTELAFYRVLRHRVDRLFDECSDTSDTKKNLAELIKEAQSTRKQIAKQGGSGYGNRQGSTSTIGAARISEMAMRTLAEYPDAASFGKTPIELTYPTDPSDEAINHLFRLGNAIWIFKKQRGHFPEAHNRNMVRELRDAGFFPFSADELIDGNVVDHWQRPYIYRYPGRIFRRFFDLYSIGADGRDDDGEGDDILYSPRQK